MDSQKNEGTQSRTSWRWILVPVSIYAVFLLWQNWPGSRTVPDELIGTWRSSDPRYADRSFEIGKVTLNFGAGEGTVTTGFIQKVKAVPEGSRTLYTIFYRDDGKEQQCSFYYTPAIERTIYFKNQPDIPWIKDKDT